MTAAREAWDKFTEAGFGLVETGLQAGETIVASGRVVDARMAILGDAASDLLVASPFQWFEGLDASSEVARDWVRRCAAHPRLAGVAEADARLMAELEARAGLAAKAA